ncbi:unnamed protein product [Ectocarpus sp. 12 AP-2014]
MGGARGARLGSGLGPGARCLGVRSPGGVSCRSLRRPRVYRFQYGASIVLVSVWGGPLYRFWRVSWAGGPAYPTTDRMACQWRKLVGQLFRDQPRDVVEYTR